MALALASDGGLYIADQHCNAIRLLKNGVVSSVAGNPKGKVHTGPVDLVRFISVQDVVVDSKGRLYILDNGAVKVIEAGVVSDVSTTSDQAIGTKRMVTTPKGLYGVSAGYIWKLKEGKISPVTASSDLLDPRGVALNKDGDLLVADRGAHRVFIYLL